jgi:4,5:9,10-diseco-3-hydroxy-5,9,17-trioxoandrosta-1(10),2-diene-4-oate hydrolase
LTDAKRTDGRRHLSGFESRELSHRGTRLRYFVAGEGAPVVLVHGLGGAASNWRDLAPLLARTRRVLVPELPGHGGSSPLPAAATLTPFADRILAVAEHEAMLPSPFVGHSMGGVVVLRSALVCPDAVTGVVLAGAAGIGSATRRARVGLTIAGLVQPGRRIAPRRRPFTGTRAGRYAAFGHWGVADPAAFPPPAADGFLAGPLLHSDTFSAAQALVVDDPRRDLHELGCPALVLWGARDKQLPIDDAFDYARRLRARLRVIPDCGHLLIGERPDACLDAIESFLDGACD